jgi:hypothetical protein
LLSTTVLNNQCKKGAKAENLVGNPEDAVCALCRKHDFYGQRFPIAETYMEMSKSRRSTSIEGLALEQGWLDYRLHGQL